MIKAILNSKRLGFFKKLALVFVFSMFAVAQTLTAALPQDMEIKGKVTEEATGEPLIGVSVVIKGSTVGTITDFDGNYTINAKEGDVLVFSYIGYTNQELAVTGQAEVNVAMATDNVGLDEVVVVGYGVQKKKLNTGATLNMKGEDLAKLNTSDAMSSLQGISPGVAITPTNGRPGAGTEVIIRGVGTIGNAGPLYVVDGVQVDNIDYLSPSDIESIDVLKDAASSAIYGSQAANGVILVTTKKGKKGQAAVISYDMYYGIQSVAKNPNMLSAKDYIAAQTEALENVGREFDFSTVVPDYENVASGASPGTDWFDAHLNKGAKIQSHTISAMGSVGKSTYSFGASYLHNEGLLAKQAKPDYKRLTLRLNSTHVLKEWNDLDLITFGQNLTYTNVENPNVADGNMYWNDTRAVITAQPIMPIYNPNGDYHYALNFRDPLSDAALWAEKYPDQTFNGRWSEMSNPIAMMDWNRSRQENNNNRVVGNAYVEIQPIKNLKIRSSFGLNTFWNSRRNYIPVYYASSTSIQDPDEVQQRLDMGYRWITTNTATYSFNYMEQHNFTFLLGQEAQREARNIYIEGNMRGSIFQDWEHAYFRNVPETDLSSIDLDSRDTYGWALSSYFARASYDFNEKYLFTYVYRNDGSSNLGKGFQRGDFHSISTGWILSQEDFLSSVPMISYLKLRGTWGQNGNQSIEQFQQVAQITYDYAGYPFGVDRTVTTPGSRPLQIPNPEMAWETSQQTNIGVDAHFLNSRLQSSIDWYDKTTKDWLVTAPALLTNGAEPPTINGGEIKNKGIELMLKWSDQQGDFKYSVTGTLAYNKNEVTRIDNAEGIIHGSGSVLSQGAAEMHRAQEGYPVAYFWGLETNGILTSDQEVTDYIDGLRASAESYASNLGIDTVYDNTITANSMVPGEIRFVDQNGDGIIDENDRVDLGNPHPDFIYGLQLSLEYKNFYAQIVGTGKAGHQIARSYRGYFNTPAENYPQDIYDRAWHAERNPGGDLPRLAYTATPSRTQMSDIYIYDADYFRISNITIGYNFKDLIKTKIFSDLRLYVTAQNIATFTKYPGMDPEVGYGPEDWSSGFDLGLYPLARTFMGGLSVKF